MNQPTTRMCRVETSGKPCPRPATYKVTVSCSGCPASRRNGVTYVCDDDLSSNVQGNITCRVCGKKQVVKNYEKLPDTTVTTNADQEAKHRIGDLQRNTVLDQLSEAFAGGFLTREEFDQRSDVVQSTVYNTDLIKVTEDLELPANNLVDQASGPAKKAAVIDNWSPSSILITGIILGMTIGIAIFTLMMVVIT